MTDDENKKTKNSAANGEPRGMDGTVRAGKEQMARAERKTYRQQYNERVLTPWSSIEVSHLGWMGQWNKHKFIALWDTGSEWTVISKEVAQAVGAELTDGFSVRGIGGRKDASHAVVNLRIGDIVFPMKPVDVVEINDDDHPDVWIGMDIINMGRFELDSSSGKTVLTFEI